MLTSPTKARRMIAGTAALLSLGLLQVSVTEGAVASNETVAPPIAIGPIAQGAATSSTEAEQVRPVPDAIKATEPAVAPADRKAEATAAAATSGSIKPAAHATIRPRTASIRPARADVREASGGSWAQRHFVLMLGIGY